jgi:5'-3' exonuclease
MKYQHLLVDISNIYYRAYFSSRKASIKVKDGIMPTNGVFVSIKMIQKLVNTYLMKNGILHFLFDNASSGEMWRKNLDPDYKINRRRQDPGFYRGLDFLQILLIHYENDWRVVQCSAYEADDLVDPVLSGIPAGDKVGIVSNDLDWARAISSDVVWIRAGKREGECVYDEIDPDAFRIIYGFPPSLKNICIYKSFRGDRIDNISAGVKRISKKMVLSILSQIETIDELFDRLEDLDLPDNLKRSVMENRERILLNHRLVDYRPISVQACKDATVISRFNPRVLKMLYSTLKFDIEKIDMRLAKFYKHSTAESSGDFKFEFSDYGRV